MDFIAKKYTVLMNDEPVALWIKNNQIKQSKFMDRKVQLDLSIDTIKQIKDHPTRIVNGANFSENIDFTEKMSKMMSQQLELAIAKNDKKTLSRFARSDLVPSNMKENFIEAINRPRGLRGLLVKAVNQTNAIFKNLAHKIDRYFDRVKDRVANQKLDKYLEEYQFQEFNKAPPVASLDLSKNVDKKLKDLSQEFVKNNDIKKLDEAKTSNKILQNEFMQKAARLGLDPVEAKIALFQTVLENQHQQDYFTKSSQVTDMQSTISELKNKLEVFEKKEASKNETLEDFKILTKNINQVEAIDILIENKEYLKLDPQAQQEFEDTYIFKKEPLQERAAEIQKIDKVFQEPKQQPKKEIVFERNTTTDFKAQATKDEIVQTWSKLQKINREQQAQNRDFMNISAVRFGGVSQKNLEKWQENATKNSVNKEITQKFVDATLRNAKELEKSGIFVQKENQPGEYKFKDAFAKEVLFKNLDKPVIELETLNKGVHKEITINAQEDIKERIAQISSKKSFEKILNKEGNLDSQQLHKFAEHIQQIATQLHQVEQANVVTKDDLKLANQVQSKTQSRDVGRERA